VVVLRRRRCGGTTDEVDFDGVSFALDADLAPTLSVVSGRYQRLGGPLRTLRSITPQTHTAMADFAPNSR